MENQELNFVSFGDFVDRIRRHKWTLISCIALSLLPAIIYNYLATPRYKASAIVSFERFSKDNMLNLDLANTSYEESFIANRITELKTWTFAESVFNSLPGPYLQLFPLPNTTLTDYEQERQIIATIQEDLSVEPTEKGANLLTVSFEAENAELAKTVTNTAVEVLRDRNLDYRRQEFSSLKQFIDQQIEIVQQKLESAETALSDFKGSDNITSLEDESREVLRRITQTEIQNNQVQTTRKAKERELDELKKMIAELRKNTLNSSSATSSPRIVKLKEQLVDLEVEATSLQVQGYPENHPRRIELENEIKGIKENLLELTTSVIEDGDMSGVVDPIARLQLYLDKQAEIEIDIQTLIAQQGHLEETLQSYNRRLNNLSTMDATLFDLLRDQEVNNKLYVRLLEEREQARLREAAELDTMHMLEQAQTPVIPFKPRKKLNIIVAILVGSSIGVLLTLLKDSFDDVPHFEEELEAALKLPVVATVPRIHRDWAMSLEEGYPEEDGHLIALYRDAYTSLWHCLQTINEEKLKSVMIASATQGEGKSTVAANLAITAAKIGEKTLLIDGDLRRPMLSRMLDATDTYGLSNLIHGDYNLEGEETTSITRSILMDMEVEGLKFLSAGTLRNGPGHFWALPKLRKALNTLMADFDLVVIDSPPVLGIPDSLSIASYVDGVILCVEAEQADRNLLMRARKILTQTNINLIGTVWNKVDPSIIYGQYNYGKYY